MTFYRSRIFPALAGLLWFTFLTLDLTGRGDSTWVKFAAICLCCATALTGRRTADGKLVAAALCLTVGADWFLLVQNGSTSLSLLLGLGLFIPVQLLYALRLFRIRGNRMCRWGVSLRLAALLLCGLCFLSPLPLTVALSLFYFTALLINTAEAFALGSNPSLFALGLLFFVFCDLCVGAYNLGIFVSFTWWGSWLFYLPSQAMIVLSQEMRPDCEAHRAGRSGKRAKGGKRPPVRLRGADTAEI